MFSLLFLTVFSSPVPSNTTLQGQVSTNTSIPHSSDGAVDNTNSDPDGNISEGTTASQLSSFSFADSPLATSNVTNSNSNGDNTEESTLAPSTNSNAAAGEVANMPSSSNSTDIASQVSSAQLPLGVVDNAVPQQTSFNASQEASGVPKVITGSINNAPSASDAGVVGNVISKPQSNATQTQQLQPLLGKLADATTTNSSTSSPQPLLNQPVKDFAPLGVVPDASNTTVENQQIFATNATQPTTISPQQASASQASSSQSVTNTQSPPLGAVVNDGEKQSAASVVLPDGQVNAADISNKEMTLGATLIPGHFKNTTLTGQPTTTSSKKQTTKLAPQVGQAFTQSKSQ